MTNRLRQNKIVIYNLKRQFGITGHIQYMTEDSYDAFTGKVTREFSYIKIRRIIMLPDVRQLMSIYSGPFYQSGREFTYGAFFDEHSRTVIIDNNDLKNHNLDPDDKLIIRNRPYSIKKFALAEELNSYLAQIVLVEGEPDVQPTSS